MESATDRIFVQASTDKLKQLAGRIQDCLGKLTSDQVWARGGDNENAIGNLVLHLCGNLRQWIGSGVGGKPDIRVRDREFAARGDIQPAELAERLRTTMEETVGTLAQVTAERLSQRITVQKYDVTVLEAIFHVVQHFAEHTGQILFATKQLTGTDLGYYRHLTQAAHQEKTP
jgi:uncharacterized damage-inducible protein DinB